MLCNAFAHTTCMCKHYLMTCVSMVLIIALNIVEMKLKFLHNISHYYNNIYAFHMHMFIISILNFNKLNTTIHSNIIFMVITYNQNLHFKIHCKKNQKQDYNSCHHKVTLQKIHTKDEHRIQYRSMCLSLLLKT
jgi:hypothetical protein